MALGVLLDSDEDSAGGKLSRDMLVQLHSGFIQVGCGFLFWGECCFSYGSQQISKCYMMIRAEYRLCGVCTLCSNVCRSSPQSSASLNSSPILISSQGLKHYITGSSARRWLVAAACIMYTTSSVLMGIILQQNIVLSEQLGIDSNFTPATKKHLLNLRLVVFWLPKLNVSALVLI